MASDKKLDLQVVLDGLGQGVLIFSKDGKLLLDNLAARTLLGPDLKVIRDQGWSAATTLFNTRQVDPDQTLDSVRKQALESTRPIRFRTYRSGQYIPCWAAAIQGEGGEVHLMITLDVPDWSALTELIDLFRSEVQEAVSDTEGHTDLIVQSVKRHKGDSLETLSKRIMGFTRLISVHMHRIGRLMEMMERLENVRMGRLSGLVRASRQKVALSEFVEDFLESLDETVLLDPETEHQDYRSRLKTSVADDLQVAAAPEYLSRILRDMLRNAIMYSMKATPVKIVAKATSDKQAIQIDVVDEGYGIRGKEFEQVFVPFKRARQPQIMGEFGYGLSLHLCKQEVEAMGGRLWFESEEGVGSTFSFKLPVWRGEDTADKLTTTTTTVAVAETTTMPAAEVTVTHEVAQVAGAASGSDKSSTTTTTAIPKEVSDGEKSDKDEAAGKAKSSSKSDS